MQTVAWRKNTRSSDSANCVEVKFDWRKSTRSGMGDCIEVKSDGPVSVRDTKDRTGPVLSFSTGDWKRFLNTL